MALLAITANWFRRFKLRSLPVAALKLEQVQSGVAYRLAEKRDIYELLAIERDVYEGTVPWTYTNFEREIVHNSRAVFIVATKANDKPVAFIGARADMWHKELHITNFAVGIVYQRNGIGTHLIAQMIELAKNLDTSLISLEVRRDNQIAQGFYRKQGFESSKIVTGYYDDGIDAVVMTRKLVNV